MNKSEIRQLKSHYLARWAVLRHNQKHNDKILLLNDLFVLKNLLPGHTVCYNCLGEMYQGIVPDLSTTIDQHCNNLVLVNNIEFKYKTLDQIAKYIETLSAQALLPGGRIIMSFEHRFLIYNRVSKSVDSLIKNWTALLKNFKPVVTLSLLGRSQPGYGDHFICLEYRG
jgi:hypothetical protein